MLRKMRIMITMGIVEKGEIDDVPAIVAVYIRKAYVVGRLLKERAFEQTLDLADRKDRSHWGRGGR